MVKYTFFMDIYIKNQQGILQGIQIRQVRRAALEGSRRRGKLERRADQKVFGLCRRIQFQRLDSHALAVARRPQQRPRGRRQHGNRKKAQLHNHGKQREPRVAS